MSETNNFSPLIFFREFIPKVTTKLRYQRVTHGGKEIQVIYRMSHFSKTNSQGLLSPKNV